MSTRDDTRLSCVISADLPFFLAFHSRSFLALISGCPLTQMSAKILKFLDRSALFRAFLSGNGLKRTGPLLGSFMAIFKMRANTWKTPVRSWVRSKDRPIFSGSPRSGTYLNLSHESRDRSRVISSRHVTWQMTGPVATCLTLSDRHFSAFNFVRHSSDIFRRPELYMKRGCHDDWTAVCIFKEKITAPLPPPKKI